MGIVALVRLAAKIEESEIAGVFGPIFQNGNDPTGNPCIRLSNSLPICLGFQTNSRWMAGRTYSCFQIRSSAVFTVIAV